MDKKPDKYAWYVPVDENDPFIKIAMQIQDDMDDPDALNVRSCARILSRAFPDAPSDAESTEDARTILHNIRQTGWTMNNPNCPTPLWDYIRTDEQAIAELERFAAACVERFGNALVKVLRRDHAFDMDDCVKILNDVDAALEAEKEDDDVR